MPSQLLDVILFYIDFHTPTSTQSTDFRKTIFIFLRYLKTKRKILSGTTFISFSSNAGGKSIIDLANQNHLSSIKRENYNILQFQQLLSNASFHENGNSTNRFFVII
jgi:hypothetical protein